MIFETQDGEYKITYNADKEIYQVLEGDAVIKESRSYAAIVKYLETGGDKKEKPKRLDVKAWGKKYNGWEEVVITSLAEIEYGSRYVWITTNGKRSKESLSSLYQHTEHNSSCVDQMAKIEERINEMRNKSNEIRLMMTKIKPEDLQDEGTEAPE